MTDLQREKEIETAATWNAELSPDDARYLLAELKDERSKLSDYAAAADALVWREQEKLEDLAERTRQTVTDWERWAIEQDNTPPNDLLEWSRLTLEELDHILKENNND